MAKGKTQERAETKHANNHQGPGPNGVRENNEFDIISGGKFVFLHLRQVNILHELSAFLRLGSRRHLELWGFRLPWNKNVIYFIISSSWRERVICINILDFIKCYERPIWPPRVFPKKFLFYFPSSTQALFNEINLYLRTCECGVAHEIVAGWRAGWREVAMEFRPGGRK